MVDWNYSEMDLNSKLLLMLNNCNSLLRDFIVENNELVKNQISKYFNNLHKYAFERINSKIAEVYESGEIINFEIVKRLIIELEKEGMESDLEFLGIEPEKTLDYFAKKVYEYNKSNYVPEVKVRERVEIF